MKSTKYTVETTAVKIAAAEPFTRTIYVHTTSGSIYLGGATITDTANGVHVPNGNTLEVLIPANETLYAIDGGGGATVVVLESGAVD